MAHGVHARVDRMQTSGIDAPPDRRGPEPESEQLWPGDHPVLPLGERRELLLDESFSHIENFSSRSGHAIEDRGSGVTADPASAPIQRNAGGRTRTPRSATPSVPLFRRISSVSVTT